MPKFLMQETVLNGDKQTARLGAGTGAANQVDDKEIAKAVKIVGDSRYGLCVAGDPIEAFISAVESATLDDYTIGTVQVGGRKEVMADGLQATPGTGTIAVGDFVVAGTMVAKGTALADESSQKVTKATQQPGITEASVIGDVNDQLKVAMFAWRVVSLGSVGTGAVGTKIVIERVK
jgi:hypothetical protein